MKLHQVHLAALTYYAGLTHCEDGKLPEESVAEDLVAAELVQHDGSGFVATATGKRVAEGTMAWRKVGIDTADLDHGSGDYGSIGSVAAFILLEESALDVTGAGSPATIVEIVASYNRQKAALRLRDGGEVVTDYPVCATCGAPLHVGGIIMHERGDGGRDKDLDDDHAPVPLPGQRFAILARLS